MKKEFGKWLLDIAKYMTTALLLSSVFADIGKSIWVMLGVIASIALSLILGLLLIKK